MFRSAVQLRLVWPSVKKFMSNDGSFHLRRAATNSFRENNICRTYLSSQPDCMAETVPIIYVERDGSEVEVEAEIGKNLLEVAHENDIDLEGACGGELACSTCHLVFEQEMYDKLPEKEDEEEDMLDLAFEVSETSRLGCQICTSKEFEGMRVRIPSDGFD